MATTDETKKAGVKRKAAVAVAEPLEDKGGEKKARLMALKHQEKAAHDEVALRYKVKTAAVKVLLPDDSSKTLYVLFRTVDSQTAVVNEWLVPTTHYNSRQLAFLSLHRSAIATQWAENYHDVTTEWYDGEDEPFFPGELTSVARDAEPEDGVVNLLPSFDLSKVSVVRSFTLIYDD
jgi:hypothetical protein